MCCFKKISSHVSHVFFQQFLFLKKLVCSFWQIARLQEFLINYKIGSHKHLDKPLLLPFVLLLFHHLLPGWGTSMDGWRNKWMESFISSRRPLIYKTSLNQVPNAQVCVYLSVHITKLQLQTTFPKPLYIPHSHDAIHGWMTGWTDGWVTWCHPWMDDGTNGWMEKASRPRRPLLPVWTPCLMHRCVYLRVHITKLQLQTTFSKPLYIFDVCTACDPWDSKIQLTIGKDGRRQI